jgi:hypothetical protein
VSADYWDGGYAQWPAPVPYGSEETYAECVGWLAQVCRSIEDWGAGPAWARRFVPEGVSYLPVDFSAQACRPGWSQVCADLATYRSTKPDGILMRHVLEHDPAWRAVLDNALDSFGKRMCVVVHTPLAEGATVALEGGPPGWSFSFAREDLTVMMGGLLVDDHHVVSQTAFGGEHVFMLERA